MNPKLSKFLALLLSLAMLISNFPASAITVNAVETEINAVADGNVAAKIGDTEYATLQAALNAAKNGDIIVLQKDCADNATLSASGKNITIDGNGKTYTGKISLTNGNGQTITVKNATLSPASDFSIHALNSTAWWNIVVDNCICISQTDCWDTDASYGVVYGTQCANTSITIKNSEISGFYYSAAFSQGGKGLTLEGCNITDCVYLVSAGKCDAVAIKGVTYSGEGGMLMKGEGYGKTLNLENTSIKITNKSYPYNLVYIVGTTSLVSAEITGVNQFVDATGTAYDDLTWTNLSAAELNIEAQNGTKFGSLAAIAEDAVKNGGTVTLLQDIEEAIELPVGTVLDKNGFTADKVTIAIPDYDVEIDGVGYSSLSEAIANAQAGDVITLKADMSLSQILVIDKAITLDGNGHTLTSSAARAINVSGANGVTIKNLTINASGERAINIIQNATNVVIENVTATAANYTVNVATSAPNAVVAIKDSNLTGLNVVNVAAAGAVVTVDDTTVVCNDQTTVEHYAALFLTKEAAGATITATNVTFVIKGDSKVATNAAKDGTITINGSTDGVTAPVAYIAYGDYAYTFDTLEAALATAKPGDVITLIRDVAASETIIVNKSITLDLNGNDIIGTPTEAKAYAVITNYGNLTIKDSVGGGAIICDHKLAGSTAYAVNTIVNSGTLTIEGGIIENKSTASNQIGYAIDNNSTSYDAVVVIKGGEVKASGSNYYDAIRLFCNSLSKENSVIVEGGKVSSIWLQNPSDGAIKDTKDVKGSVTISGGIVNGLYLEPSSAFEAAISGGHVGKVEYFTTSEGRDLAGFITGGTFSNAIADEFCAEGFIPVKNSDGTYGVVKNTVTIGSVEDLLAFANAVTGNKEYQGVKVAANSKVVVLLTADLDLTDSGFLGIGNGAANTFCGTFNGQNYTISNMTLTCNYYRGVGFFRSLGNGAVVKNVTFDNANVNNGAATGANHFYGVVAGFSNDLTLDNVDVKNSTVTCKYSGAAMVGCLQGSTVIKNADIENVTLTTTDIRAAVYGVIGNSASSANTITVENNTVSGNKFYLNGAEKPLAVAIGYGLASGINTGVAYIVASNTYYCVYATLQDALEAAKDGDTITLIRDIAVSETIIVNKSITLDLNGNNITSSADVWAIKVEGNSTLTLKGEGIIEGNEGISVTKGSMFIMNGGHIKASAASGTAIQLFGSEAIMNAGTITSEVNGVKIFGDNSVYGIFTMNGGEINTKSASITANGGERYDNVTVTINGGKITSANSGAIFWPAEGKLTITGGEIIGESAIYMKSGSLEITGGAFEGKGAKVDYVGKPSGFNATGDAIVIENIGNSGYEAIGSISITGGTFKSINASAVACYAPAGSAVKTGFIAGGTFSNAIAEELCAEGYIPVKNSDGTFGVKVGSYKATVNGAKFETLAAALAAAQAGDTITLLADIYREVVTVTKAVTIDGAGKTFVGAMVLKADTTIKNVNFDGEYYGGYAVETRGADYLTIEDCTATNYGYGFVQLASATVLTTVKNVTVSNMNYGVKVDYSSAVVLENVNITAGDAAVLNSNYGEKNITIKNSKLNILATWVRNSTIETTYVFEGDNTIGMFDIDAAIDTFKLAVGATLTAPNVIEATTDVFGGRVKYEDGKYFVKVGLEGSGTESDPYQINNLEDLIIFRDFVNAGESKYNNAYVKLMADIDLSSVENWIPIGNVAYNSKYAPAEPTKVFAGVFDGNGKVISNLKMTKIMNGGADAEANLGLFGITGEGAVIKNLTITNVNINTDGRNVGALVAFAYKATIDNITVNGNIQIKGGNNVSGVIAMSRHNAVSVTNITVQGKDRSKIVGNNIVGGIFAEIAPNGTAQTFKNLSVENVAISGVAGVGGIVGLLTTGTVDTVSVKNVALTGKTEYQGNAMGRIRLGSVAGLMGGKYATIANATVENVTAQNLYGNAVVLPIIGANYDASSNATEAKIGDTYYATLVGAIKAAQDGDTIKLITKIELVDTVLTLDKSITLDFNGYTLTGRFTKTTTNVENNGSLEAAVTQFVLIKDNTSVIMKDSVDKGGLEAIADAYGNLSNLIRVEANGALVIESGNYHQNISVVGAGMIDSRGDEIITINGGTFTLDNVGKQKNGSPWIFNAKGQNTSNIIVNGGTFNDDIQHQHHPFEVDMSYTKALKKDANGIYTVVPAVAYVTEAEWSGRWYYNFVGYATLEEAIAACQGPQSRENGKYISNQEQVVLLKDIELQKGLVIKAGKSVVLDLNGYGISQEKECTAHYSMITNYGSLTIVDEWGGSISFTDTGKGDPNYGWGSYTIYNNGNLVIDGGKISYRGPSKHCGLALFQYSGSTVINGGMLDSNYRSVRLWMGDMTINGGKFVGQVWVQAVAADASLTINGGRFQPVGGDFSSVFVENAKYDVKFAVNGGTFATKIGVSDAAKMGACINKNGVTINGMGTAEELFK